jgi:hypothetical protein
VRRGQKPITPTSLARKVRQVLDEDPIMRRIKEPASRAT